MPNMANQTQDIREDLTKKKSKFLPPPQNYSLLKKVYVFLLRLLYHKIQSDTKNAINRSFFIGSG